MSHYYVFFQIKKKLNVQFFITIKKKNIVLNKIDKYQSPLKNKQVHKYVKNFQTS